MYELSRKTLVHSVFIQFIFLNIARTCHDLQDDEVSSDLLLLGNRPAATPRQLCEAGVAWDSMDAMFC